VCVSVCVNETEYVSGCVLKRKRGCICESARKERKSERVGEWER